MPAPGANREPVLVPPDRVPLYAVEIAVLVGAQFLEAEGVLLDDQPRANQVTSCSFPVAHSGKAQGRTI